MCFLFVLRKGLRCVSFESEFEDKKIIVLKAECEQVVGGIVISPSGLQVYTNVAGLSRGTVTTKMLKTVSQSRHHMLHYVTLCL